MNHNQVATTCTASLLTGWSLANIIATNEKDRLRARMAAMKDIERQGWKRDFAIIHAFLVQNQKDQLGDFLEKMGWEQVFHGTKFDDDKEKTIHRHKETGDLYLYAIKPKDFEEKTKAYMAEVQARLDIIDPPKRPDPKRLAFPEMKINKWKEDKIVHDNASVNNPIHQVLLVPKATAERYIKLTFGTPIDDWCKKNNTPDWTQLTYRRLKDLQTSWRNELI